jgi:rod shape determining protein RodA
VLLAAIVLLDIIAALNLWGIGGADHTLFRRQVVLGVVGIAVFLACSRLNYRYLKNWSFPVLLLYGIAVILLSSTLFFEPHRNIKAWIIIGGQQFEPSELAKLALIIVLAKYFSQRHVDIGRFRHIIVTGLYTAIPAFIILAQPDLGSAAILFIIWGVMLLAAGINRRHLFLLITVALVGSYSAWIWGLEPYQKDRILAFADPYRDPTGYGYHVIQSRTAIGAGGLWGTGLGDGSQSTLGYLPEPYNDFAFAAWIEQTGLAGALLVLTLSGIVVWRVLRIGQASDNNFARLFCAGVAVVVTAHTFISAGVNIGLLPITGIPYSFLSYGGSHLISLMVALGIVQNIAIHG